MTQKFADYSSASASARRPPRAVVVVPGRAADVFTDAAEAAWLRRASLRANPPETPLLERLLPEIGLPLPSAGRAALRLWGQTGERPVGWVAAADPVWMQAGMEKVFVHVPPVGEVGIEALATLFADLQDTLFADRQLTLRAIGEQGYVHATAPLLTALLPATAIDRARPDAYLPDINDAAARDFYALSSEIEMLLHQHPLNVAREQRGQRPLNALWLWGGGNVEDTEPHTLPPVFTADALLKGYCHFSETPCSDWPGSLTACAAQAPAGFVAAFPDAGHESLPAVAADLRSLWQDSQIRQLLLLFDDIAIDVDKSLRGWLRFNRKSELRKYLSGA